MITPEQCRAARGLLDWSQQDLADKAAVGVVTVRQFEGRANAPRRATLDVIRRAFEAAGADVLYAPRLPDMAAIREVCAAVSRPVNVVMGLAGQNFTVAELAQAGVKRISLGSALARAALAGLVRAAREVRDHGSFGFADDALRFADANGFMASRQG